MTNIKYISYLSILLIASIFLIPYGYADEYEEDDTLIPATFFARKALKSYPLEMAEIMARLKDCDYRTALQSSNDFVKLTLDSDKAKQNKHLALLERGKIALAAGHYQQSIADLQAAEERFLTIEGTISLQEGFGSILTDDTTQEYEAEMHEKLMISPYLILAYLQKGDFSGARIERNRTLTKISQYIEEKPEERAYLENPFARYLTAIMYEMENKNDDAKIEYRKMQWDAEVKRLESKIEKTTDLLILVDVGTAPQKQEMKWGPQPINAGGSTITLGFAYAAYSPTTTKATNCNIYLNEQPVGTANILYNLEDTVITQYEKNKPALLSKLSARMAAKALTQLAAQKGADTVAESSPWTGFLLKAAATIAGVAWVNAEQADLRSWLTLPKQINYLRLNDLAPGEHAVTIDYGCGRQTKTVKLEKDKINIAYFVFVQ